MSELTRDDIRHLSTLSRLELSEEEYARYATQLTSVVGFIEQLKEVDVSAAGHAVGVTGLKNVMAPDELREAGDPLSDVAQNIVKDAPQSSGRFMQVRAVLATDDGASS